MTPFARSVLDVVAAIREGEVLTYGEVAVEAGAPGAARAVGRALATHGDRVPWWRVVTSTGNLAPGLEAKQRSRLAAEGVECAENRVVLPARGSQVANSPQLDRKFPTNRRI